MVLPWWWRWWWRPLVLIQFRGESVSPVPSSFIVMLYVRYLVFFVFLLCNSFLFFFVSFFFCFSFFLFSVPSFILFTPQSPSSNYMSICFSFLPPLLPLFIPFFFLCPFSSFLSISSSITFIILFLSFYFPVRVPILPFVHCLLLSLLPISLPSFLHASQNSTTTHTPS